MVGLPNFLSRMTLRPDGPSVAFTAFDSFSTPRSNVCRAFSSNCSCLAAIRFVDTCWLVVKRFLRDAGTQETIRFGVSNSKSFPACLLSLAIPSSILAISLSDDAEDIVLTHDQIILVLYFDFGAAVFGDQHLVALLHREIDFLSVVIDFAG